ncbi:MAG: SDR family NAD(P)-dependent oxidoreductase [Rhodospirillales bacterium]|nr:SDR family NAD(P)-dependent oxidoreductase [Rhodospirillales bacterium]
MLPDAFDVTDKVVLITGAGRGIGKGIAQVLAEAGADVAINSLTPRYVEGVAAEIAKTSGRRVVPVVADVTQNAGVRQAIDTVMDTFGRIDVLVNNLGDAIRKPLVALPGEETPALTDEELNLVIDVNLTEAILCTRAVGPHMLGRRSGKVINISSWTARQGGGDMVVYSIAKTGLAGFTRAQALEWAPYGVHVNSIAPGIFPDPVTVGDDGMQRTRDMAARSVPLLRHGELREVGYLALYLASAASDYMTGQTLFLDGGMSL